MNVIKEIVLANDKDFKEGDLVEIIEVTDHDQPHKEYCYKSGMTPGTIMIVSSVKRKQGNHCQDEDDRIICNEVCKDNCVSLRKIDNKMANTHSCYTRFKKIGK